MSQSKAAMAFPRNVHRSMHKIVNEPLRLLVMPQCRKEGIFNFSNLSTFSAKKYVLPYLNGK